MNDGIYEIIESLRQQIFSCETTLKDLRQQLAEAEDSLRRNSLQDSNSNRIEAFQKQLKTEKENKWPLMKDEYERYGRQLIMPEIGLQGQLRLKNSRVLIVGIGGLGCPAIAYLAGAGVGTLGLIDCDTVEVSNLHRQILHSTATTGISKVQSAKLALMRLNPNVSLISHEHQLVAENSVDVFKNYDLVLDCTDTPASRYLISDTCVLLGKPLISASALRIDGQLMVLNNPPLPPGDKYGGPCYRCVFPTPPPPESVVSCGEGGILGPVVGVMGVLQALEAIKILTRRSDASLPTQFDPPTLLIFTAYSNPMFRSIRLRTRKPNCAVCSAYATISLQALKLGSIDYVRFCGSVSSANALSQTERISAMNYAELRSGPTLFDGAVNDADNHILLDVREKVQYELCSINGSISLPYSIIATTTDQGIGAKSLSATSDDTSGEEKSWIKLFEESEKPIFVICRLGNDSQLAVKKMKKLGLDRGGKRFIGDIAGGLYAWRKDVDHDFPNY